MMPLRRRPLSERRAITTSVELHLDSLRSIRLIQVVVVSHSICRVILWRVNPPVSKEQIERETK